MRCTPADRRGQVGLDWIDKTSFGDGYRRHGSPWACGRMGYWAITTISPPGAEQPSENFQAAAAEALGARVLRQSDPDLAAYNLRLARADFRFATQAPRSGAPRSNWHPSAFCAVDLYRATGEQPYRDEALRMRPR